MPDLPVSTGGTLVSNFVLRDDGRGIFLSASVQVDATAPTATYYVQLVQGANGINFSNGALPAGATFLAAPRRVEHVSGTTDYVTFDETPDGVSFAGGCSVFLSSTRATKTDAGAYMAVDGSVQ
jgi:hypothetical protein